MKRWSMWCLWALCVAMVLSLSGCVKLRSHVTINTDGSADVEYVVAMDAQMVSTMSAGGDPFKEVKGEFVKEGFKVAEYKADKLAGITATKHVKTVNELSQAMGAKALNSSEGLPKSEGENDKAAMFGDLGKALQVKKSFFTTSYRLKTEIDMAAPNSGKGQTEQEKMQAAMGAAMAQSIIDMSFALTLPVKPKSSNATKVSKDGKTMEWALVPNQKTSIQVEGTVPNTLNIALTSFGGLLVVFGVVASMMRRKPAPVKPAYPAAQRSVNTPGPMATGNTTVPGTPAEKTPPKME